MVKVVLMVNVVGIVKMIVRNDLGVMPAVAVM